MECPKCGNSNPNGQKFCGGCGAKLGNICPVCSHENLPKAKFCGQCGSALGNPCPNCGLNNPISHKFCIECGSQLDKYCPECNSINPPHARFCNQCGNKLSENPTNAANIRTESKKLIAETDASQQNIANMEFDYARDLQKFIPPALRDMYLDTKGNIEGEKKIVSMIFSDVSGFTALSAEHADEPEEVQRIINDCLKRQADQVYALEGYVDKFVGDEMVALFGAPIWHEDDVQRSVMAALKMRDAVEIYSNELEKEKGIRLHVHIGINTGRVSVGGIGNDMFMNYTVMGDPVNMASRIEHIAAEGEIIVGELTHKLTKASFRYREARNIEVKGKTEPQTVYELIGPKEHPEKTRGIIGLSTHMIGRESELEVLRSCAREAFAESVQMVSIIGEAGFGKSRLKQELKDSLQDDAVWIEGQCFELSKHTAYSAFLDAIKSQFGVMATDTEEQIRYKITSEMHSLFSQEENADFLAKDILAYLFQLMSLKLDAEMEEHIKYMLDDPEHLQKQIFLAIKNLLLQIAGDRPFVLALEDLHWMDDLSLELLLFLMENQTGHKGLILCISRSERESACLKIADAARSRFPGNFREIILHKLADEDMKLLLDSLMPLEQSDDGNDLKELILQKAEGNPLYLEEVIGALLEEKIVDETKGGNGYVVMQKVADISVPTGVESIVRARIDSLTSLRDGSKQTLLRASVIGRVFERRILEKVSSEDIDLDRHLERLLTMDLIAEGSGDWTEKEYSFRHILIHNIAYDSIISREKRKIHGKIASCMVELYPEYLYPDKLEYIVGHYRLSDNYERAIHYLIKAGHKARLLYNNVTAIDYYSEALEKMEMLDQQVDIKWQVYEGLGDVYRVTSRFDKAIKGYQEAIEYCNIPESRASICRKMGNIYEKKGNYDKSKEQYEHALAELKEHPESIELPRLYNRIGFIHYRRGEYSEAMEICNRAIKMLHHRDDYVTIAKIYKNLAIAKYFIGSVDEAFKNIDLSVAMAEKTNDRMLLAQLYNTRAGLHQWGGNIDDTLQAFQRVFEMRLELGDVDGQATTRNSLAMAHTTKGEYDTAISYLKESLELAQRVKNTRLIADSYMNMGVAYHYKRELDKAIECYRKCREIYENISFPRGIALCTGNIAEVYREKGELEKAERNHIDAIDMAKQIPDRQIECHQYQGLGEIYLAKEKHLEALQYFENALKLARELDYQVAMGDACKGICIIYQKTNDLEKAQKHFNQALAHYTEIGAEAKLKELKQLKMELAT